MTNLEKLRETFPKTIFIFRKNGNDETAAIMCSDEWLQGDYDQMYKGSEPCEDCVSKEAVLDLFETIMTKSEIYRAVIKLPPVTPKPKTGKWTVYKDCEGKTRRCVCDQCGYETGKYTWRNPNFCEECGAKMEGERE